MKPTSAIRVPRTQAVANPSAAIFVPSGRYGALMFIRDAARIPTMPPRKPRKKKPAFCPLVSARSIVISIWSFPVSLEYICPMVITTNFDFRERILNATADDPWGRVFDRIVEVGFPVKYDGNSRRREIGMKNRKDFKRKLGIEGIES